MVLELFIKAIEFVTIILTKRIST